MARYFLHLAYRGANYHGWQTQPNDTSVQQTIETALSTLLHTSTPIVGAGRTDAGVNARCMYAHFDSDAPATLIAQLPQRLTAMCGRDIAIYDVIPVDDDAHARFDATARTYRYFVSLQPNPFTCHLAWQTPPGLDIDAMHCAAQALVGTHDFTSFSKLHTDVRTNICTVRSAEWHILDDNMAFFQITADRFLRNMVRAIVGTLVEVGRGKQPLEHVQNVMDAMNRGAAGTSMPGYALFLWNVEYPYSLKPLTYDKK